MITKLYTLPIFFVMLLGISLRAQEIVPVAFGLKSPIDINADTGS
jgi:hypothetical protein